MKLGSNVLPLPPPLEKCLTKPWLERPEPQDQGKGTRVILAKFFDCDHRRHELFAEDRTLLPITNHELCFKTIKPNTPTGTLKPTTDQLPNSNSDLHLQKQILSARNLNIAQSPLNALSAGRNVPQTKPTSMHQHLQE